MKKRDFIISGAFPILLLMSAYSSADNFYERTPNVAELLDAAKTVADHGDLSDYAFTAKAIGIEVRPATIKPLELSEAAASIYKMKYDLVHFPSIYRADGFFYASGAPPVQIGFRSSFKIAFSDLMCVREVDVVKSFSSNPPTRIPDSKTFFHFYHKSTSIIAIIEFNGPDSCAVDLAFFQSVRHKE